MDFNSFNKDKHRYNNVLVIMDYLSKESVSIPCHKTTTTKEMASLFIYHVWRYFGPLDQCSQWMDIHPISIHPLRIHLFLIQSTSNPLSNGYPVDNQGYRVRSL